jgi:hypothetical protein
MAALKAVLFFFLVILGTCKTFAEELGPWGVITGSAGYQGEFFAGGLYRFNDRHTMVVTLGTFTLDYTRAQLNVGYVYSPYEMAVHEQTRWTMLDCGVSLSFALDRDNYFLRSPVQYPQTNYYDQTKDRASLQIGTSLEPFNGAISIRYFVSLLTVGAVAFFNNREGYRQFLSSGISLKISL